MFLAAMHRRHASRASAAVVSGGNPSRRGDVDDGDAVGAAGEPAARAQLVEPAELLDCGDQMSPGGHGVGVAGRRVVQDHDVVTICGRTLIRRLRVPGFSETELSRNYMDRSTMKRYESMCQDCQPTPGSA